MNSPVDPERFSRRTLLKGAAGLGGLSLPFAGASAQSDGRYSTAGGKPEQFDFTKQSGALQPDQIIDSACQFCNSLCRLKVHVKSGRIIDVQGEPGDPVQAGRMCVKGPMMTQLVY